MCGTAGQALRQMRARTVAASKIDESDCDEHNYHSNSNLGYSMPHAPLGPPPSRRCNTPKVVLQQESPTSSQCPPTSKSPYTSIECDKEPEDLQEHAFLSESPGVDWTW